MFQVTVDCSPREKRSCRRRRKNNSFSTEGIELWQLLVLQANEIVKRLREKIKAAQTGSFLCVSVY